MKKKVVITLSLVLLALFAITSGITIAWLTQQGPSSNIEMTVGSINYQAQVNDKPTGKVVPGDALGTISLTNTSDIATNLRISITATSNKQEAPWTVGLTEPTNTTDQVIITLNADWVKDADGYIYYKGKDETTGLIAANGAVSNPFTLISLNGLVVTNTQQQALVTITITFQAKQQAHVTWDQLGQISWDTGVNPK